MKKIVILVMAMFACLYANAGWVRGHYRKNGSYVRPHYRSSPGHAYRRTSSSTHTTYVNSYTRRDGTYVKGHWRNCPSRFNATLSNAQHTMTAMHPTPCFEPDRSMQANAQCIRDFNAYVTNAPQHITMQCASYKMTPVLTPFQSLAMRIKELKKQLDTRNKLKLQLEIGNYEDTIAYTHVCKEILQIKKELSIAQQQYDNMTD